MLVAAASVSELLPLPGAAMLARENVAVTPVGRPLTDNATAELNPFSVAVVSVTGMEPPPATVALVAPVVRVKLGATTVRPSGTVFVTPPPVAVTVRL